MRKTRDLKRNARDFLNKRYGTPMLVFLIATLLPVLLEALFSRTIGTSPTVMQYVIFYIAEYLIMLVSSVLNSGVYLLHLNMARSRDYKIMNLFAPFRDRFDRYFGAAFLQSLISLACCIPLFIGVAYFSYALPEEVDTGIVYDVPNSESVTDGMATVSFNMASNVSSQTAATNISTNSIVLPTVVLLACIAATLVLIIWVRLRYYYIYCLLLDYPEMKVTSAFRESMLLMRGRKLKLLHLLCSFLGWLIPGIFSFGIAALWIYPYLTQSTVQFYLNATGELDRLPRRSYQETGSVDYTV